MLELLEQRQAERQDTSVSRDAYNVDRRIEARHAELSLSLPRWAGGYEQTVPAALALLDVLQTHAVFPAKVVEHIAVLAGLAARSPPETA